MVRPVLFIIDNPHRELRGLVSVQICLKQRGVPSVIASKATFESDYDYYQPSIVVFPRVTDTMAKEAIRFSKNSKICLIPAEHGAGSKKFVMLDISGHEPESHFYMESAINIVDRIYFSGNKQKEWLLEEKVIRPEQAVVTGTLNSDHWFLGNRFQKKSKKFKVGIATTNRSFLFGAPIHSVPARVNELRSSQPTEERLWRVDDIAREGAFTMVLTELIEKIEKNHIPISLRPHPHEYFDNWKIYADEREPGFELDRSLLLHDWLSKISLTISSFSTTAVDAFAHGIPAISLSGIVPERFTSILPQALRPVESGISWMPKTQAEALELILKAQRGELALSPDMPTAEKFCADYFDFPRKDLAAVRIANDLAELYRAESKKVVTPVVIPQYRGIKRLLVTSSPGRYLVIWLRHLKAYFFHHRKENIYFPFNLKQRLNAKHYASQILRATEQRPAP